MKRLSAIFFFAIIFCLTSVGVFAQTVTYLDADYKPATATNYTYKRTLKFKEIVHESYIENPFGNNPQWNARPSGLYSCSLIDSYKTGETALVSNVVSLNSNCSDGSRSGEAVYYYKNGKIKRKEFYKYGKLQGIVINYDEKGNENKREEYANGKLIEANKFASPADSPITGTWKNVECYNNDCSVKDNGYYETPPTIVRTSIYIYSQDGVVESIHDLLYKTEKIKGNWKYTPKNDSSGVLEEYLGTDLVERGNVKFLSRNQLEYTITSSQNADSVGKQYVWTRQ